MADRAHLERLSRELAAKGLLIEAGFLGYRLAVMSPAAPAIQLEECKLSFFAGALHLYHSIMTIMDPGAEPTAGDLNKARLIHEELEKFGREFQLKTARPKGSA